MRPGPLRFVLAVGVSVVAVSASCSTGDVDALRSVELEPNPINALSATLSVDADEPVRVDVTATAGSHVVEVPRTAELAETHDIALVGLRADQEYTVEVELTDGSGDPAGSDELDFGTGALPDFIPELTVTVDEEGRSEGLTLIEITPGTRDGFEHGEDPLAVQQVVALDRDGEVVWYQDAADADGEATDEAIGDVRLTEDGTILSIDFPGAIRETDLLGNEIANWSVTPEVMPWTDLSAFEEGTADEGDDGVDQGTDFSDTIDIDADWVDLRSLHHEAYPMPDGNILALSNTLHELTPGQRAQLCPGDPAEFWAISDVVVEFTRGGDVIRTWDLWDVIDIMETPGGEMCSTEGQIADEIERDWTHGNAVVFDAERDAVVVSNRHTSQIVALPHGTADGPQTELLWTIGTDGTIPLEGDLPRYQHAVEIEDDGSLLFYDNGNGRAGTAPGTDNPPYSRAALYELDDSSDDPADWTATQTWEHRAEETPGVPIYAGFLGDADRLANGNVLIDHGGIPDPEPDDDHNRCVVMEVIPDADGGDVIWRLETGTAERPMTCYRTEQVPSLYTGSQWE